MQVKVVDKITIQPKQDFILVKVDSDDDLERTKGGIIIPKGSIINKKTHTGTVVAVGPGRADPSDTTRTIPMQSKVGERITFAVSIGFPVVMGPDEVEHVIIKDYDAMGVVIEESHMEEVDEHSPRIIV